MSNNLAQPNFESLRDRVSRDSLSESEYFRLLASAERRAAIAALEEEPHPADLRGLAYATVEHLDDVPGPHPELIDDLALRLHHVHLPKLDAAGLVDYDPRTNQLD